MDRISDLPDCILLHILSFLPTKTAFLTTVLSRRWIHLCDDLQHLDFEQYQFQNRNNTSSHLSTRTRLFAVVNGILFRHKAPPIRTFRLICNVDKTDEYTVVWFIRKVLGPNLEELNLELASASYSNYRSVVIPNGVFSCTSLVTLRLHGHLTTLFWPSSSSCSFHLPSLKTLEMHNANASLNYLEELFSHCTALETLILSLYDWGSRERQLRISFSSLKSLHFRSGYCNDLELLVIDTPSLKRLDIEVKSRFCEIRVRNLHNVEEASINHPWQMQSFVLEFLVEFCGIRSLVLGNFVFYCLRVTPRDLIPELTSLRRLELAVGYFDTRYIMDMLQKCHMLKVLVIVFITDKFVKDPHPSRKWEQPAKVPTCLASHLQVIKINGYYKSRDDRDFFKYVLQQGLVLESLEIQVDCAKAKGFPKEISLLPRSSKACQIIIYTNNATHPTLRYLVVNSPFKISLFCFFMPFIWLNFSYLRQIVCNLGRFRSSE